MLEFLECIISDSLDIRHVWYFLILFIKCLIPGLGRSPGEGKCYPFQYSDLEDSMDCIIHGVAESDRIEWLSLSLSSQAQLCQKLWNPVDCIAQQAPLSLGFSRQKYCSGLSFSSPSEFLDQGLTLHLCVCCIAGGFFSTWTTEWSIL